MTRISLQQQAVSNSLYQDFKAASLQFGNHIPENDSSHVVICLRNIACRSAQERVTWVQQLNHPSCFNSGNLFGNPFLGHSQSLGTTMTRQAGKQVSILHLPQLN